MSHISLFRYQDGSTKHKFPLMMDSCVPVSSKTDGSLLLSLHCIKHFQIFTLSLISSVTLFFSFVVKLVEYEPLLYVFFLC